jgi:plastocyanin
MKTVTKVSSITVLLIMVTFPISLQATKHVINVLNFSFSPASLSGVVLGDTIRWVWQSGTHTTTSTTIPVGAANWNSPITSTVTSFEYRVTVTGTYNYKCTPHASMGMVGDFTATAPLPSLNVTPANQNVPYTVGTTEFQVTSNSVWTTSSNRDWCTVTQSGSGNGTLVASFSENPANSPRIANISVSVEGLPAMEVTVTQASSSVSLNEYDMAVFKLYPNPTVGIFTLSLGNANDKPIELSIRNIIGNEMMRQTLVNRDQYSFDMTGYSRGLYFVNLKMGETIKSIKLLLVDK